MDIAQTVAAKVGAEIVVLPSNDPRSYRVCSDRLLATGFRPKRTVAEAIGEMVDRYRAGTLKDEPAWHNVKWMKQHALGG